MTTGAPLYVVSACGSAEEFVAAFRRYADRTGLFIPAAAPLPAGRRGRLALTLKDGGVMIEGEAEILQSSAKPTILHGRPGMTVKFVEPDEPSKAVIGELEKARLAMRPPPPTVPPRPAQIPAEPRPVPPAPGGRIDAANALAECVVIGDVTSLRDTATSPKSIGDAGSNKSKFVVPAIPAVGARPKTPSTPPEIKPPTAGPAPKLTSIGFPIVDKLPAKPGSAVGTAATLGMPQLERKPDDPLLTTHRGTSAPTNPTMPMPASDPVLETHKPARADATPAKFIAAATTLGTAAPDHAAAPPQPAPPPAVTGSEEATAIGQGPPKPAPEIAAINDDDATTIGEAPPKRPTDPTMTAIPTRKATDPMPTTAPPGDADKKITDPMPAAAPVAASADASAPRRTESAKHHKATSIGFPVVRHPFETQPLALVSPAGSAPVRPEAPVEPAPPTLPKSGPARGSPGPRGKTPTTPPLTPRHPTPVAPVPIVRPPAKAAPVVTEEERTDLSAVPPPPAVAEAAAGADSGANKPMQRSGGMRASEILAAIPTEDWTMTPDESVPHVLPSSGTPSDAPTPTPAPAPAPAPKGPPTGDWTIALDPESGWSEPEKVAKAAAAAAAAAAQPASGNPVMAVASEEPFTAVQWDEKPTGIGESKIEIDPTLMGPLKPMPPIEELESSTAAAYEATAPAEQIPPPLAPMPPRAPSDVFGEPSPFMAPAVTPSQMQYPMQPMQPHQGLPMMPRPDSDISRRGEVKREKMIALAIGAGAVAVGAIVLLVLVLGKDKPAAEPGPTGSGSAAEAVAPTQGSAAAKPEQGSAAAAPAGSGSAPAVAVQPAGSGSETKPAAVAVDAAVEQPTQKPPETPVASGPCKVQITSVPNGADVLLDKKKLGTTPGQFELPCGVEVKLTLRKKGLGNTARTFTAVAGKPNKLAVKLGKTLFLVKVTSTPAGATIKAGGKMMGVTPTTIRLPAFETSAITLTKPGFAPDTQKIAPKANSTSHHVTLKKGKR